MQELRPCNSLATIYFLGELGANMGDSADGEVFPAPETLHCCGVGNGSVRVQLGSLGDAAPGCSGNRRQVEHGCYYGFGHGCSCNRRQV